MITFDTILMAIAALAMLSAAVAGVGLMVLFCTPSTKESASEQEDVDE